MGVERIWALSDVHTDRAQNMRWIHGLKNDDSECYSNDTLILAGDISDNIDIVRATLASLQRTFKNVWFCPGNHDLWVRKSKTAGNSSSSISSLEKMEILLQLCSEMGIHTKPGFAGGAVIAPILSWHHKSWDTEPEVTCWDGIAPADESIMDYVFCAWPEHLDAYCNDDSIAKHLDQLNDQMVRTC
jgi:UDP-2,3-diacylglucosamine pyrophosphatase LpxH